jgi:hypothetical protein
MEEFDRRERNFSLVIFFIAAIMFILGARLL